MSSPERRGDPAVRRELDRLEAAVGRALERIGELEGRLTEARARGEELERLLASFESGEDDPATMKDRLDRSERENVDMRSRLQEGRDAVERLLARIRFLEDQR